MLESHWVWDGHFYSDTLLKHCILMLAFSGGLYRVENHIIRTKGYSGLLFLNVFRLVVSLFVLFWPRFQALLGAVAVNILILFPVLEEVFSVFSLLSTMAFKN